MNLTGNICQVILGLISEVQYERIYPSRRSAAFRCRLEKGTAMPINYSTVS